jgi:hypothetical protein
MTEKQVSGLYAQFKTDPDMERSGIELEYYIDGKTSVIVKIARAGGGNTKYQRVVDARTKPYRRQIQTETIAPETLEAVMREVYADAVVLGWFTVTRDDKGNETRVATVEDADGNPMEFNRDNVVKLFRELPDMFSDVQTSANKVALFRKDELEASAKNS